MIEYKKKGGRRFGALKGSPFMRKEYMLCVALFFFYVLFLFLKTKQNEHYTRDTM